MKLRPESRLRARFVFRLVKEGFVVHSSLLVVSPHAIEEPLGQWERLMCLGLDPGPPPGMDGVEDTRKFAEAVTRFQQGNSLEPTGLPDPPTLALLEAVT